MLELISTAADGLQLLKAFTDDQNSANPKLDRLDDDIVAALRQIYFIPHGVLSLLKQIADGKQPDYADVELALPRFNDAEWRVGGALRRLEFEDLSEKREISLKRARLLDQLRYGKINLRRSIQEFLNYPLTVGERPSREAASELVKQVEALNAQIEAFEEAHNHRARR